MQSIALARHPRVLAEEIEAEESCRRIADHPLTSPVGEGSEPAQETQQLTGAVEGVGVKFTGGQLGEPREQTTVQHLDPEKKELSCV